MEKPGFLKEKYNLHNTPEVDSAAKRTEAKTKEKVSQKPEARIQNYLDRLKHLALDPDKKQKREMFGYEPRPRALSLLREMVMNKYVRPNKEKMAEGAARVEERAARELGIEAHYGEQELEQRGEIAVEDLEKSLDEWIKYLSDANEPYPIWFRYYVFRNILDLGDYDKDKGEFTKRSEGTIRLFPEVDRGALGYVQERMEASKDLEALERLLKAQKTIDTPQDQLITKEKAVSFAKLSFAKQYAEGIKQAGEITSEMREEKGGKWVKYQKGTDPTALWASLQNKGTAWCTKGFATAETQLKSGDFYVYYTNDKQGKPTIPRIAIRMQEDSIGEVRGVADNDQNLEGNMADIAEKKMAELPGAERYRKASADMKTLTAIDKKVRSGQELKKDDLIFLYEINSSIEGFGYQRDPRIEELRSKRNSKEDAPIVLDCKPEEIAHSTGDVDDNTKAYIGKLPLGIFDTSNRRILPEGVEHIYTSFPEGKIRKMEVFIGGKSKEELKKELAMKNIKVTSYATSVMDGNNFTIKESSEKLELVRLTVKDLGFSNSATTQEIFDKAKTLGLDLCPAEVGPNLRLQYENQPLGEWVYVAMKPITDSGGNPRVFNLVRDVDGLWLHGYWANPDSRWRPGSEFVFCLRK
ncbi:MAG: hypothetical protein A3B91_02260 [Candidatus Yanofskybacteria bacterium RIFCSPHIGHO2_02_FULL_41_29]|uniref:Uncharacterized protein n=1 Tax=Candidatus Yanofskybacteria bacterium RIFCSPHIGHO2_01_FULL_41_53 TaxID=1802663 RepID=A0A1F8EID5_9BACT|nr:MAG: hypothetical protein A2650_01685 [Candidatus Yanofskybacteria bacterium RIFCSPHIGHO2_01_FULL_41_53]OGN12348.1 MAG: hypothetical protein A3B91_02260 [Candidatus Yanofskybacteria bacterium RIFCSPHIGHO2_02_FULL_41_29]OGN17215.1 MAG: hypothetical protein A3F48_00250 [Candidatus Yanofskybacteria bacterium RIFCSPHIGHO2_12_FULL_41_9]OGN23214.1 MAG: hypothetical protein A2916_02675 [Candidatus Yanofskybacteria bacterium RIFCSPLOWO2_01_FULL_41_67]OGN28889.1 MAG: hypothetical protein A3H54_01965 